MLEKHFNELINSIESRIYCEYTDDETPNELIWFVDEYLRNFSDPVVIEQPIHGYCITHIFADYKGKLVYIWEFEHVENCRIGISTNKEYISEQLSNIFNYTIDSDELSFELIKKFIEFNKI